MPCWNASIAAVKTEFETNMFDHQRIATLFIAGSLCIPLSSCGKGDATEADSRTDPPLVRLATVEKATQITRRFTGIVSARVQSDLGFRVAGKVIERLVDTGQTVKKGDLLMRIDNNDYALAISAQRAAVEAAKAQVIQTAADEKRYKVLVGQGAVSSTVYDRAKGLADVADAQLNAAEAQVKVTENTSSYSEMTADSDGTVVQTLAEPGQVVTAGQTVVQLAHSGPREAKISLPETFLPKIGSKAQAIVFRGQVNGDATLRQLSNSADAQTRTFEARYVLGGAAAEAPLGSTIDIVIPDAAVTSSLQVPLAAIFDNGAGPGVWVLDGKNSKVNFRPVGIAELGAESANVSNGLQSGDQFVALGAHLLHENEQVRVDAHAGAVQ
jgi:RND family efflux transporter MFP subunit